MDAVDALLCFGYKIERVGTTYLLSIPCINPFDKASIQLLWKEIRENQVKYKKIVEEKAKIVGL